MRERERERERERDTINIGNKSNVEGSNQQKCFPVLSTV